MFSLNWNLYNKTPWDYLREYKEEKQNLSVGEQEKPTPEQLKKMIEENLTDEERREYFDLQKSKDIQAQKKVIKKLKEEQKGLKYEYLEKGREFGNYEGIYGMTSAFVGQRQHHKQYKETYENQKEQDKLFTSDLINLTPLNAETTDELVDELIKMSNNENIPAIDKKVFNVDQYKKRLEKQDEYEENIIDIENKLKKIEYDMI